VIGGSSPAILGRYCFNPWLLKVAGVAKELYRIDDFASDALPMRLASERTIGKIIEYGSEDVGNSAVTVLSLAFMRLRSFAVNSRTTGWKQRAIYSWSTLLWFTSFQHFVGSTMMANKRNMVLETIGTLFIVTRFDITHLRRCTSECNEHLYGIFRMMLREFNVEQFIRIVQKAEIKMRAIFESNLVTSRSKTSFKGYQETLEEFLESLKGEIDMAGPVEVDLSKPAVTQLWEEVRGVIEATNSWMIPFLGLFGAEAGNGLSPFATSFQSPADLLATMEDFFRPPKRDLRGSQAEGDATTAAAGAADGGEGDENDGEGSVLPMSEKSVRVPVPDKSLPANVVQTYMDEINDATKDDTPTAEEPHQTNQDEESAPGDAEVQHFFDLGDVDGAYNEFKALILCRDIGSVSACAHKLVQLLELGTIEKGSVLLASKHNSRNGRWFNQKVKTVVCDDGVDSTNDGLYIQQDSLIQLKCKRGKSESVENYRVLGFFTKFYNKWFVSLEDRFAWDNDQSSVKNVRVLAQLMKKSGSSYQEVTIEKDGDWGPGQVFCVKGFVDILKVENELVGM
jgi:hypothetical protein